MRIAIICAGLSIGLASAQAEEAFTEHHAHEHGAATLEVATEGKQLLIALDSPAANVLGFEHAPRTAAEIKAVAQATAALGRGAAIFTPSPAAQCKLNSVKMGAPQWDAKQNSSAEHADYEVSYRFNCAQPAALTGLGINFSGIMSSATRLRAAVVTPKAQFQRDLTAGKSELKLP